MAALRATRSVGLSAPISGRNSGSAPQSTTSGVSTTVAGSMSVAAEPGCVWGGGIIITVVVIKYQDRGRVVVEMQNKARRDARGQAFVVRRGGFLIRAGSLLRIHSLKDCHALCTRALRPFFL